MSKKILVVGSTNVDFTVKTGLLPARGETVTGGVFNHAFGGKGANQAVAAARAGCRTDIITCLGCDEFAPGLLKAFRKEGIQTRNILFDPAAATGVALIMVEEKGDNYIAVASGANHRLLPGHIDRYEKLIRGADFVVLQMEIPEETNRRVVEICATAGTKVLVNCAPFRPLPRDFLRQIEILVVNEHEAASLTARPVAGREEAIEASNALLALGAKKAIITLGSKGSVVNDAGRTAFVPAFSVRAVDATAAGDTYCGTLAAGLTEGKSLAEAARFASAAAALACTRMGAQSSIPRRPEIDRFLGTHD